jgi:hypothetical protein
MIQTNGVYLLIPQSCLKAVLLHYRTEYFSVPVAYAIHKKESQGNMHLHNKYLWKFESDHTSPCFTVRPINLKKSVFSFVYETAKHGESLLTETIMTLPSTHQSTSS